ncbi:MAG: polymorphic toxin-type HINT domain-containing protein, partial [Planctomycetaceae bacterium]
ECGINGWARVLGIGECPQVSPRPGPEFQLVTATYRHQSKRVLDVQIAGNPAPLGTTANHPFWSADRQDFVRADELAVGEHLQNADGSLTTVTSVTERPGLQDVFNLEVQTEHVYHVAQSGVLVHNGTAWKCYENMINRVYGAAGGHRFPGGGGRVRIADGVIDHLDEAIESKHIGNWARSIYNPANKGTKALQKQYSMALQMKDYSSAYSSVSYYTNNSQMATHLKIMASRLNLPNVSVFVHP